MHEIILMDRGFTDLNPVQCGWEACAPGYAYGPTARPYYMIHYVSRGKGTLLRGGKTYTVPAGSFFLVRPDEVTLYRADRADPWDYVWICFSGTQASVFDALPEPVDTLPRDLFDEVRRMINDGFPGWHNRKEEYLVTVLYRLITQLFSDEPTRSHYAERAANYIRTEYDRKISVEQIADSLSLDRRYLSRLFRTRYGVSMRQYLADIRLRRAAHLLKSGYSVSETAGLVGYEDRSDFSRMFKRKFGVSPQQFKE